jgi:antitoxin PrlF
VRAALGVKEGDELAYAIEDGRVVITKAPPHLPRKGHPSEDPFATFREWDTEADERAFADL